MESKEESVSQAAAHWEYVKGILEAHGVQASVVSSVGYHYQTAFVHGWKHAVEYIATNKLGGNNG